VTIAIATLDNFTKIGVQAARVARREWWLTRNQSNCEAFDPVWRDWMKDSSLLTFAANSDPASDFDWSHDGMKALVFSFFLRYSLLT